MGKDSKRRNRAAKKLKAKLHSFPVETVEHLAELPTDHVFSSEVATSRTHNDAPQCFILKFDYLKEKTCEFGQLDGTKMNKILSIFKRVTNLTPQNLPSSGIIRDKIERNKPYLDLFTNLSPDVDLLEASLPAGGRMFFFYTDIEFQIISIETKHRNIDN